MGDERFTLSCSDPGDLAACTDERECCCQRTLVRSRGTQAGGAAGRVVTPTIRLECLFAAFCVNLQMRYYMGDSVNATLCHILANIACEKFNKRLISSYFL